MESQIERELVKNNEEYASKFNQAGLALPPSKKYAIVTCMDARLDPSAAYGIPLGSALIIRNAGASAHDAFRSLLLGEHLLGIEEVLVIKHTRCGLLGATNDMARQVVKGNLGPEAHDEVDGVEFYPIGDLEESTRADVEWLRGQRLLLGSVRITGWVYDIDTGRVRKVVE